MWLNKHPISKLLMALIWIWNTSAVHAETRRDFLLDVVRYCIEPKANNYCSVCELPRSDSVCDGHDTCPKSLEVWQQTKRFLALRDMNMCSCPSDFVHGLVLPLNPITGVEDPNRPDDIWAVAWSVGISKIDATQLALVVNPRNYRDQDQLHVHMVRLKSEARSELLGTTISHLGNVWQTAQLMADEKGLKDYGVLVAQNPEGGYLVVIDEESPEHKFTLATCQ